MEQTEQLVRSFMVIENREADLDAVVSGIERLDIINGNTSLLNVVKALGEYLTSEDDATRAKGVGFLSAVIAKCPADKITKQSSHVLVKFFCGKLDDSDTIIPALRGLVPLTANKSLTSDDVIASVKAIFEHVVMKVHIQSTRLSVFTIIDQLFSHYRDVLKTMGNDFLRGYIELAEGEKDPRNLMLAFSIARVILIEFDISNFVDDLFNITFCYFPISFRPPPDDPYGITPDDLKLSLRLCLNATPRFGPLAIPLFLEKLSAGSGSTKRDTLKTIASCLPVYGITITRNHALKLWTALKLEIFQPIDPETAECALETTQTIIQVVYPSADYKNTGEYPEGLGKLIVEECLVFLKEPEKSKAKPAIKVLASLVQTTGNFLRHNNTYRTDGFLPAFITRYTISETVPHLISLFRDPLEISNRPATLTAAENIVRAVRDVYSPRAGNESRRSYEIERPLDSFKDELLGIFIVGLKITGGAPPALLAIDAMVKILGLLTGDEIAFVVHSINELLVAANYSVDDDVRMTALDVLSSVSLVAPKHIEETTLPLLFGTLPDSAPSRDAYAEHAQYRRVLSSLTSLCTTPAFFETLVVRLSTKLDLICTAPLSPIVDREANAAYVHAILSSLSKVLSRKVELGHSDIPKYLDRLVPRLYGLFIDAALSSDKGNETVAIHPRLIHIGSRVIQQIIQTASAELNSHQGTFAKSLFNAYFGREISAVVNKDQAVGSSFKPFDVGARSWQTEVSDAQKALIPLFTAPLISFRKEVRLPVEDEPSLLVSLSSWSLDTTAASNDHAISVMHAISSIVNKHTEGLSTFISVQGETLWEENVVAAKVLERRRRAIRLWTWLTKSLVLRNYDLANVYVDKLFSIFVDSSLGWDAAKAIGSIGSGGDDVLTKQNFAIQRVLSTQKYFNSVLPRIVEGVKSHQATTEQTPYLVALASLIKSIPKTMYAHKMNELMPLLLRGLDLPDMEIRADVIETLHSATKDTGAVGETVQNAVSEHAGSLVTAMLKNAHIQGPSFSRLRQVSLQYVGILPQIVRYDILHPYKMQVIRDLGKCLDDPKRHVRKEAVESRFTYGG
ncbi:ARM repeat-containing protein [Hysterangium stoloniferum]|nr:ARM repeat-containing protein [Hysterangium stoloniferum]